MENQSTHGRARTCSEAKNASSFVPTNDMVTAFRYGMDRSASAGQICLVDWFGVICYDGFALGRSACTLTHDTYATAALISSLAMILVC